MKTKRRFYIKTSSRTYKAKNSITSYTIHKCESNCFRIRRRSSDNTYPVETCGGFTCGDFSATRDLYQIVQWFQNFAHNGYIQPFTIGLSNRSSAPSLRKTCLYIAHKYQKYANMSHEAYYTKHGMQHNIHSK